jgi:2-methylcitrate synthase
LAGVRILSVQTNQLERAGVSWSSGGFSFLVIFARAATGFDWRRQSARHSLGKPFYLMPVIAKGLEGIIANSTGLSDVLGKEGVLIYAGYDINEIAGKATYEEIVYLLWHGALPNRAELDELKAKLKHERELPRGVIDFIKSAPPKANPMDVMRTAVSMLGLYDSGLSDEDSRQDADHRRAISITAKIGVIAAYFHRARQGLKLPNVRDDLGEAAHFLYLLNGTEPSPEAEKTLDVAYVLHADHGMNASTFSARVTIATLSDIYSAITSAIGTLKGPLHGGANEGVIHMLLDIGSENKVDAWVEEQLAQKKKIMGIGHRVYKVLDPRAPHLRSMAVKLSEELGEPKWIRMSERIAEIMKEKKGLNANVDFYSATVYHSLGIPTDMFTPIFAIARTSGWTAHVLEQLADNRLYRPLSEYVGPPVGKKFVPLDER